MFLIIVGGLQVLGWTPKSMALFLLHQHTGCPGIRNESWWRLRHHYSSASSVWQQVWWVQPTVEPWNSLPSQLLHQAQLCIPPWCCHQPVPGSLGLPNCCRCASSEIPQRESRIWTQRVPELELMRSTCSWFSSIYKLSAQSSTPSLLLSCALVGFHHKWDSPVWHCKVN